MHWFTWEGPRGSSLNSVWQGWEGMALLEKVCHWEQALEFQKTAAISNVFSTFCLKIQMWVFSCFCHRLLLWTMWNHGPKGKLSFYYRRPWSWCSCQSDWKELRHHVKVEKKNNSTKLFSDCLMYSVVHTTYTHDNKLQWHSGWTRRVEDWNNLLHSLCYPLLY